jgi:hypothetical protein
VIRRLLGHVHHATLAEEGLDFLPFGGQRVRPDVDVRAPLSWHWRRSPRAAQAHRRCPCPDVGVVYDFRLNGESESFFSVAAAVLLQQQREAWGSQRMVGPV